MSRLILLILFSSLAIGVERPTYPEAGEDRVVTKGQSARDFFNGRAAQKECRQNIDNAREAYRGAKATLATLISTTSDPDEIDAKEVEMNELHDTLLDRVEDCGECVTRPIEPREIRTGGRTEYWYISDGSCYVGDVAGGYDRARQSLREVKRYGKKTGGFSSLLEFAPINWLTGKLDPDLQTLEKFPAYVFVALKGAEVFGVTGGYTQVFKAMQTEDASVTNVRWEGVKPPRGFTPPPVFTITASGKKRPALVTPVPKAISSWHLTSNGYLRYFLAADFGTDLSFAQALGRRMLQDTIGEMADRYVGR